MASRVDDADELLQLVKQQFEEYADTTRPARANAEKCRRYRDGDQWTAEERETLKKRKQPCITDNKIQDKCDTLLGIEKQMRTDPKAFPRNPQDEGSAEAATDGLRYVADVNDFHRAARKPAADNLMVEGLAAGQVIVEKRKGKSPKISMEHIRWDRVFYDVHSLREDFADKTYCGYFTWMDRDAALEEFPGKDDVLDQSFNGESLAGADKSLDDKPRYTLVKSGRKRVQVFTTYFKRTGKWFYGTWCKGGWLDSPRVSTYKNEDGEPDCCIELQAMYRDAEGNPYGAVQRYLDLQDEHNKRRSKMLHLLNSKRMLVIRGTFPDLNAARAELHKPDGVIEVDSDDVNKGVRVEDNIAESEGQWRLLQQTDMALDKTGPNAALSGQSGDLSGRAKQLDQQSGTMMISPLFEALDAWELRMYRQVWNRIRQFWTAEMWIRVTDDEQKVKFVGLNTPVMQGDQAAEQMGKDPEFQKLPPEDQQAAIQQLASHPQAQQAALDNGKPVKKNDVAAMDMDIIIDRTQDVVNVQQEQFEILASIAEKRPEVPFDILIEMSQLRSDVKKRVEDKLSGADNPQAQQQAKQVSQMQQLMGQLEARLKDAEATLKQQALKTAAETDQIRAQTIGTHIDAATKVVDASTAPPMEPPQPPMNAG